MARQYQQYPQYQEPKRPLIVTILGLVMIFWALVYLVFAFAVMGIGNPFASILGIGVLLYALWRFIIALGVLSMKKKAWKPAMITILIWILIDLITGNGFMVFLELFTLLYLLAIKKQFYR